MLEDISKTLGNITRNIGGKSRLTEKNVSDSIQSLQTAMLEGDVSWPVVEKFIDRVKHQALGKNIIQSVTPGQMFVRIVHQEMSTLMGGKTLDLNIKVSAPAIILLCGLQGSGKTTIAAKLARYIRDNMKKRVMLASCDIYRPAALEQLQLLADQINVPCLKSTNDYSVSERAQEALTTAKSMLSDILIVDTAGRTTIDQEMMTELQLLHHQLGPSETLFVIDAMLGQDAVNIAKAFGDTVPLTGLLVTKLDGDARGGAVMSAAATTGKMIKFVGDGEKIEDISVFHPDRMASRILGMGDIVSLVEEAQSKITSEKLKKLENKFSKKKSRFTLDDYLSQITQAKNMGGIESLLDKMPNHIAEKIKATGGGISEDKIKHYEATIFSMTSQERKWPDVIKASRKRRIAEGSGTSVQTVNNMLKEFEQAQKVLKKFAKNPNTINRFMNSMFR